MQLVAKQKRNLLQMKNTKEIKIKLVRKLRRQKKSYAMVICLLGLGRYTEISNYVKSIGKNITFEQ